MLSRVSYPDPPLRPPERSQAARRSPPGTAGACRGGWLIRTGLRCLLFLSLIFMPLVEAQAQNTTITSLPSLTTHALTGSDDGPLVVALGPSASPRLVHLSLSLCAVPSSPFAIYVTNSTKIDVPSTADFPSERRSKRKQAGAGIWFVALEYGFANWTGVVGEGGLRIAFEGGGGAGSVVEVEVAISESGTFHAVQDKQPILGDTTSTHILFHTPSFADAPSPLEPLVYPNYTLPRPLPLTPVTPPSTTPNETVYILPTGNYDLAPVARSWCAVRRAWNATGLKSLNITDRAFVLGPADVGWRERVIVSGGGLEAGGNYTLWTVRANEASSGIQGGGMLSGPVMFRMKRDTFPCPLVHSLSVCPSISYAAALDRTSTLGIETSLPSTLQDTLEGYLNSFARALSTYACGRDVYSPVATCEECYEAYREWLCRTSVPRCGEEPLTPAPTSTDDDDPSTTPLTRPALLARNSTSGPRLASSFTPSYAYTELLPCLESCHIVDRLCPVFLGFRCPRSTGGKTGLGTARASYGVGYVDLKDVVGGERRNAGPDRWGNLGCELWEGWTV